MFKKREVSLRRLISRQANCSRRSVYQLDENYDFPSDEDINACIAHIRPSKYHWAHEIWDCDDIAREFWSKSKDFFQAKGLNCASAFMCRRATAFQKAHCLNFFIRKSDHKLIFIDNFERVPSIGRAYLVIM